MPADARGGRKHPLEVAGQLHEALQVGVQCFRQRSEALGYSPFEAHDLVRVYQAFAKAAGLENAALENLIQAASSIAFAKLSLIASVIDKDPSRWRYWLDLAESLPLQDLRGPVGQALQELKGSRPS